ncbi:MAG: NAD-dependent epimerase/dehydratase family protein [Rhodobacteraceae bacterium]|nr:NAD-dependent epimerase/dehydratase family protein [Paracoccaceae bacterium]
MRIFFTGGAGKAGRYAVQYLTEQGHQVTNIDQIMLDQPGVDNLKVELTDAGQVYSAMAQMAGFGELDAPMPARRYDAVVHFAAIARVLIVPDNETFRINAMATYNVLEAATRLGIPKIIIASSETTYGICFAHGELKPDYVPVDEEHPTLPHDSYAMSKVVNEATARSFQARTGADIYALRINNVIEPHEYAQNFPAYVEDASLRRRNIFGYIDARDLGHMVDCCLKTDGLGYEVFNVANDDSSVGMETSEIMERFYPGVPMITDMGPTDTFYANGKAKRMVGFAPQYGWRDELATGSRIDKVSTFDLATHMAASGDARAASAKRLDQICAETGFLVLTGHGIAPEIIENVQAQTRAFFAQTPEQKAKTVAPYAGYPYGWIGPGKEALAKSLGNDTPPDLKESFNGGPLSIPVGMQGPEALAFCYAPTLWPELDGFKAAWEAYYNAMELLASQIMSAFAEALDLAPDHFDPYLLAPVSALRALHYPATDGAVEPGQQRAGAHSDYGSLTILLPQAGARGLEIQPPGSTDWVEVSAPPGAFVINLGDLMARWTANRWVSTLHRVVARPNEPQRGSLAFFHQPDWSAQIVPLDGSDTYPPVLSGPYLMERFKSTGG